MLLYLSARGGGGGRALLLVVDAFVTCLVSLRCRLAAPSFAVVYNVKVSHNMVVVVVVLVITICSEGLPLAYFGGTDKSHLIYRHYLLAF